MLLWYPCTSICWVFQKLALHFFFFCFFCFLYMPVWCVCYAGRGIFIIRFQFSFYTNTRFAYRTSGYLGAVGRMRPFVCYTSVSRGFDGKNEVKSCPCISLKFDGIRHSMQPFLYLFSMPLKSVVCVFTRRLIIAWISLWREALIYFSTAITACFTAVICECRDRMPNPG